MNTENILKFSFLPNTIPSIRVYDHGARVEQLYLSRRFERRLLQQLRKNVLLSRIVSTQYVQRIEQHLSQLLPDIQSYLVTCLACAEYYPADTLVAMERFPGNFQLADQVHIRRLQDQLKEPLPFAVQFFEPGRLTDPPQLLKTCVLA